MVETHESVGNKRPKNIHNTWALLLGIIILSIILSGCKAQVAMNQTGKPIIKIGYLPITHAGPLYVDDYLFQDELRDYEVELVKFGSFPDLMDALNTGRIQGASVLAELAMKAHEKEIDIKAVALGHQDGNVLVTQKDINDVAGLKGTTFAIPHKYSTHHLLLDVELENAGVDYEDVNIIELPPPEMPAALSEGRISGYLVAEPFGAQSVVMDNGHVLSNFIDVWPNSYCCVLVLRSDFIEEYPDETEHFVQKYVEAGQMIEAREDGVYDALTHFLPVDEDVLKLSLEWIRYDDLYIERQEYERLANHLVKLGLSENPPKYEDFVDNSYLLKASEAN